MPLNSSEKKVVLDVNILISSLFGGSPKAAVDKAAKMRVFVSEPIIKEVSAVIRKLAKKLNEPQKRLFRQLIKRLFNQAEMVSIPGKLSICRDPADDIYLETCQVARAHYLVSGDKDLLEVAPDLLKKNKLGRLKILSPADFCKEIEKK